MILRCSFWDAVLIASMALSRGTLWEISERTSRTLFSKRRMAGGKEPHRDPMIIISLMTIGARYIVGLTS